MGTPQPSRQPTLDEVAALAGVSRSAASRVINNAPHVSRAKREAVERAIAELGYVPNPTARALATSQVGSVVFAMAHHDPAAFGDPFFAQVVRGVSAELAKTDLELMLVAAPAPHGRDRLRRLVRARRADGVMLMALSGDDPLAHLPEETTIPVVFGGRPLHVEPRWYVDVDNRASARLAVEHLLRTGHRRIATITGPLDTDVATARHRGFRDAMAEAGLPADRVAAGDFTEPGGAAAMTRLLDAFPDLDALFAANDDMAAGALRVLRAHGRDVPGDVGVIGFDDLPAALHTDPQLTTIHQPIEALGREMARMLVALLAGERPCPIILPARLVERDSVRARPLTG